VVLFLLLQAVPNVIGVNHWRSMHIGLGLEDRGIDDCYAADTYDVSRNGVNNA
jgi:hypothetical protein